MKQIYLIAVALFIFSAAHSSPSIKANANNASWSINSTWDLARLPQQGDTVIIPSGRTVIVNTNESVNGALLIKIYGTLKFVGGKLSLSDLATVVVYPGGTILGSGTPSEQLRMGNAKIFQGNDLAIVGPQMANSGTNGFTAFSTLPVKFISFTATRTNNNVLVQWATSEEVNASMYEVERSVDGAEWNVIAYVAAVGTSSNTNNYSYTDNNIAGTTIKYRIRQTDIDGAFTYTTVAIIRTSIIGTSIDVKISGNNGNIILQFPNGMKGKMLVNVVSLGGQIIEQKTITATPGQVVMHTNAKGNYVIALSNEQGLRTATQVML